MGLNGAYLSVVRFTIDLAGVYMLCHALECLSEFGRTKPEDFGIAVAMTVVYGLDAVLSVFTAVEGGLNLLRIVIAPVSIATLLCYGKIDQYYQHLFHSAAVFVVNAIPSLISCAVIYMNTALNTARWSVE